MLFDTSSPRAVQIVDVATGAVVARYDDFEEGRFSPQGRYLALWVVDIQADRTRLVVYAVSG